MRVEDARAARLGGRRHTRQILVGVLAMLLVAFAGGPPAARAAGTPLTNLAHIDFLGDTVAPPAQARHTTYRLAADPRVGVLWTYADRRADGHYERVGGGPFDPATNTWGQGAFNADDVSRAAVVYLRHWRQFGDEHSRDRAYQLLRGLTYLQTSSGPDAGNVVLWMQPDGSLNPSPKPVELPDPSDSGPSYWLARTIWALGEGYAAFARTDPDFAAFLRARLGLALDAVERQVLTHYGEWEVADGARVPAWLVVDGADATAEAVLGLSAFVQAGPSTSDVGDRARRDLGMLAEGIAAMSAGDSRHWPYGAVLPWTHSRSIWHAWASQMPAALGAASDALDRPGLATAAVRDSAVFTPHLLTSTGPVNGLQPTPSDPTQIAYGVDSRVQSLLTVADTTDRPGLGRLAAVTAAWYFGANRAGEPMYDPATGRTFDGLAGDGTVNRNSGAESTIHGLLSMLALDAHPALATDAQRMSTLQTQDGVQVVEAEAADTTGDAQVATPESAWTGESSWSGGSLLEVSPGGHAAWTLTPSQQPRLVQPVVELRDLSGTTTTRWTSDRRDLGSVRADSVGPQGVSEAPGSLQPVTTDGELPAGATGLQMSVPAASAHAARVDAVLLQPRVSRLVLAGAQGTTTLLHNAGTETAQTAVAGEGNAVVRVYDRNGRLRDENVDAGAAAVSVLPSGFTLVERGRR